MKNIFCMSVALLAIALQATLSKDVDIIDSLKGHELRILTQDENSSKWKTSKYGDPFLEKAVNKLSDIPRPWTVSKIISIFEEDSHAWLQKLQHQIDIHSDQMWNGWEEESNRCGYLARVLSASRDSRAASVLGKALYTPDFPDGIQVIEGLYDYFLPDAHYKTLPPDNSGPKAYTNFYPEMTRLVKEWWNLNKAQIAAEAKSLNKAEPGTTANP